MVPALTCLLSNTLDHAVLRDPEAALLLHSRSAPWQPTPFVPFDRVGGELLFNLITDQLHSQYTGDLKGGSVPIHVQASQSTTLVMLPEQVGGAVIAVDSAVCNRMQYIDLVQRLDTETGAQRVSRTRMPVDHECTWYVAGLPPGMYDAIARSSQGVMGYVRFEVRSQERVAVNVPNFPVRVTGAVMLGGKALPGVSLSLTKNQSGSTADATTDANGIYELFVDRDGSYSAQLFVDGVPRVKNVNLHTGENRVDWSIDEVGMVEVRVRGTVVGEEARVQLRALNPNGLWSMKGLGSLAEPIVTWEGIPLGRYEVTARQAGMVSDAKVVVLDTDHPKAGRMPAAASSKPCPPMRGPRG